MLLNNLVVLHFGRAEFYSFKGGDTSENKLSESATLVCPYFSGDDWISGGSRSWSCFSSGIKSSHSQHFHHAPTYSWNVRESKKNSSLVFFLYQKNIHSQRNWIHIEKSNYLLCTQNAGSTLTINCLNKKKRIQDKQD